MIPVLSSFNWKKTSLVAKNRLCGYCVDGGGN